MARTPVINELETIQASLTAEGVLVLTGQVPTQREKDLVERMAQLEPGIVAVQNELVVAGT
ncbi:MAG: BON domain-containing protein [Planctomycetales bacterium]|nr:BON domain-containing protein [Planctomycetales bacterium]